MTLTPTDRALAASFADAVTLEGEEPASEPSEATRVCYEAYQVVGSLLSDLGKFDTPEAEKILDNLSQARLVHKDVLPWPQYATDSARWTMLTDEDRDAAFNSMPNMLDGFMKLWGWLHFAKAIEAKVHERNAHLVTADSLNTDLLHELEQAHKIIVNALQIMCGEQKCEWARRNERDGCNGDGTTRYHERAAVIARAKEEA